MSLLPKLANTKWLISGLIVVGLLVGLMSSDLLKAFTSHTGRRNGMELVPASAIAPSVVREYESVAFDFHIKNTSQEEILWEEIGGSCRCVKFTQPSGEAFPFPVRISPGGSVPFRLTVRTGGVLGDQSYRIAASGRGAKAEYSATGEVGLNVAAGLRVNPTYVRFDADESSFDQSVRIVVYDNYPGDGVYVDSISSTRPDLIAFQVENVSDDGNEAESVPLFDGLKPRRILRVGLTDEGKSVREQTFTSLTIRPASNSHPAVEIPVEIRPARPSVHFSPSIVVVPEESASSASNGIIRKTVYCHTAGKGDLKLLREVPGVKSHLWWNAKESIWVLDLEIEASRLIEARSIEIQMAYSDEPQREYLLPIRVIGGL